MNDRPNASRRYETMADAEDAIILGDESGDIFDDEDALMEDLDAIPDGKVGDWADRDPIATIVQNIKGQTALGAQSSAPVSVIDCLTSTTRRSR